MMLLSFKVSNFRSFDEAVTFSMAAGKTRSFSDRITRIGGQKILNFKALYGANASGKSNIIKAIDFMRHAVLHGIPAGSTMEYCRMKKENVDKPSLFEIDIALNGIRYTYTFEVILNVGEFILEKLVEHKGNRAKIVFSRNVLDGEYNVSSYISNYALNERLNIYAGDVQQDRTVLFLKTMNQNKNSLYTGDSKLMVYQIIYRWFLDKLSINYPDQFITQYSYFFDSESSKRAEEMLSRFDTGISGVEIADEPVEKVMSQIPKAFFEDILENLNEQKRRAMEKGRNDTPAIMMRSGTDHSMHIIELVADDVKCKTLKFYHKHSASLFSLEDESDGTIRLLDLLEILLSHSKNMVYVIDEINRCLHPIITKWFIEDFLQCATKRGIQLIVTTHEVNLLDLELLRKDEIGFVVKKEEEGTSVFISLEDFGERFDKRIRKAYIEGKYGAIPKI